MRGKITILILAIIYLWTTGVLAHKETYEPEEIPKVFQMTIDPPLSGELEPAYSDKEAGQTVNLLPNGSVGALPTAGIKDQIRQLETKSINAIVYAYNAEKSQTDNTPCITANGYNICDNPDNINPIANNCLQFGSIVRINNSESYKDYTVVDRMNARYGCEVFDIFMKSKSDALNWGKKYLTVQIYD